MNDETRAMVSGCCFEVWEGRGWRMISIGKLSPTLN